MRPRHSGLLKGPGGVGLGTRGGLGLDRVGWPSGRPTLGRGRADSGFGWPVRPVRAGAICVICVNVQAGNLFYADYCDQQVYFGQALLCGLCGQQDIN